MSPIEIFALRLPFLFAAIGVAMLLGYILMAVRIPKKEARH